MVFMSAISDLLISAYSAFKTGLLNLQFLIFVLHIYFMSLVVFFCACILFFSISPSLMGSSPSSRSACRSFMHSRPPSSYLNFHRLKDTAVPPCGFSYCFLKVAYSLLPMLSEILSNQDHFNPYLFWEASQGLSFCSVLTMLAHNGSLT